MSMRDYIVDDYGFVLDEPVLQMLASKLCDGYTSADFSENRYDYCEELIDKLDLQSISGFTGVARYFDDDSYPECLVSDIYEEDTIYYLPLKRLPSMFHAAYKDEDEIVEEVKEALGAYLPENFQYKESIRHISGTFYG